jgi:hypothetical protein
MMGGGSCPYESDCNAESNRNWEIMETKRQLDLEEQRLRIKILKQQAGESTSNATKEPL